MSGSRPTGPSDAAGTGGAHREGPGVPLGATPDGDGCTFAVWAPASRSVSVRLGPDDASAPSRLEPLHAVDGGYHVGRVEHCRPGTRYRYRLDGGEQLADPASRSQPDGVHGPSEVVDLSDHAWGDDGFVAAPLWQTVLYELHIGTFTEAGTFDAAIEHLSDLSELGVTAVEVMPVAQFPGRWNWGYDGVFPFAVQSSYGGPRGLQRFVDACHQQGLAVVLDVVYNHLGPEGNVLGAYGPYFTDRYRTPWGAAVNVDGEHSDQVRHYFIANALGWLSAFHVDALRLDAVHSILDTTARPFLADLSEAVDDLGRHQGRPLTLIAESADNDPRVVRPRASGGLGIQAQWNDDFHHALHAVVTGERAGYYEDFATLDQLARTVAEGFYFQGEYSPFRKRRHGAPSRDIDPSQLVVFAQNHDHIGNRPAGDRLSTLVPTAVLRLVAAALLLSPQVPLLFMGEEYGEPAPFPYFVDHGDPELSRAVRSGRTGEMEELGLPGRPLDPTEGRTRDIAVLDHRLRRRDGHHQLYELYTGLLSFRSTDPVLSRPDRGRCSASAVGRVLVQVRQLGHRLAVVLGNFSDGAHEVVLPEGPPGSAGAWVTALDIDDPRLGGRGLAAPDPDGGRISVPGFGALVLSWRADAPTPEGAVA